ncbi:MAG: 23S rRNA (uracil(1939)-C(5))-methyltransferase RlmD [Schleiferiaceae bacterium]
MGRKRKVIHLEGIELTRAGAKGKSIGHTEDGRVVMVAGAVPGDVVDIRVTKKKKSYLEGVPTEFKTLSPDRVEPKCEHFGVCGGCKWQNVDYTKQLEYKQSEVENNLKRIGHVEVENLLPIEPSQDIYHYRNKLEFTFSNQKWLTEEEVKSDEEFDRNGLGFHKPGMWDKVIDIDNCYLQPEPSNSIRNFVKQYALENKLPFFNLRAQEGLLRTLMIRTAISGEIMVLFQFFENDAEAINGLLSAVMEKFPEITSCQYVINPKGNDTIYDLETIVFSGRDHIVEEMPSIFENTAPLRFKVGPKSFYQTNPKQAHTLYAKALEMAGIEGGENIYDLYTGTGTIACFLAQKAGKVIGVESVPEAIEDAHYNAEQNGLTNVDFEVGDMKDVFTEDFISRHGKPDIIVTDPPRDGMHKDVVEQLRNLKTPKIVYISCNSATQARDLELLKDLYDVKTSLAVDMFPHTHHIENICVLEWKNS